VTEQKKPSRTKEADTWMHVNSSGLTPDPFSQTG